MKSSKPGSSMSNGDCPKNDDNAGLIVTLESWPLDPLPEGFDPMSLPRKTAVLLLVFAGEIAIVRASARGAPPYLVCVSNERSGDVTIIDGAGRKVLATVPVGKRPRGIHASPDGRRLYVAVSGSPITGPPKLDPKGNPILPQGDEDEEDADRSADGIGEIDLGRMKFTRKLPAGSDPEEFAVSRDGATLYISNEDVGTLSVV